MALNLETLLKEALGREYSLSVSQLTRKESIKHKNPDVKFIDKDRGFFCSEIVAKCHKIIGIIQNDNIASSQYMPNDFSIKGAEGTLKLTEGTKIGDEFEIIQDL